MSFLVCVEMESTLFLFIASTGRFWWLSQWEYGTTDMGK